jgi:hypothetical protein
MMFRVPAFLLGLGLVLSFAFPLNVGARSSLVNEESAIERLLSRGASLIRYHRASDRAPEESQGVGSISPVIVKAAYRERGGEAWERRGTLEREAAIGSDSRRIDSAGPESEDSPPVTPGDWYSQAFPMLSTLAFLRSGDASAAGDPRSKPIFVKASQLRDLLMPRRVLKSVGAFPDGPEGGFSHLQIEVSHSQHTFRLLGVSFFGRKAVLYRCKVGLGDPRNFPTPTGMYFVTHIYDDHPWWIPPTDRAWAWGHAPSKRVYGGTMAPLLKKRPVRSRRKRGNYEDLIARKVTLEDYGYRFHGTNALRSIGRNQSHGCVRMIPKDAKSVADFIKEYVGITGRGETENGTFVRLRAPVRLRIIK